MIILEREKRESKIERSGKREEKRALLVITHQGTDAFTPYSMLYQTPHPLLFQFHPFSSSSSSSSTLLRLSTTSPSLPLSSYHTILPQRETEMECVEAALKTSFRKDMGMKFSPQTFIEELSAFNNVQNGAPCDDLFVDELLDFSHVEQEQEEQEEEQQHKDGDSACVSPKQLSHPATTTHDYASVPTSELSVPDDVADLEWLSHFVEDSFSEFSAPIPTVTTSDKNNHPKEPATQKPDPLSPVLTQPCFKTPVPAKARSKRTRTGVRVWPLGSPSFTDSSSSSTTTTTSSSSSSSPSSPLLIYTNFTQNMEQVCSEAPAKKLKKKPSPDGGAAVAPRRCSHCGVQKTPQWRTGPLGAKTLCNACGVRFKSGRLLPEYRPACSPTFSSELHSNHHRKVLEMRRKKETTMDGGVEITPLAPPPVAPSF